MHISLNAWTHLKISHNWFLFVTFSAVVGRAIGFRENIRCVFFLMFVFYPTCRVRSCASSDFSWNCLLLSCFVLMFARQRDYAIFHKSLVTQRQWNTISAVSVFCQARFSLSCKQKPSYLQYCWSVSQEIAFNLVNLSRNYWRTKLYIWNVLYVA